MAKRRPVEKLVCPDATITVDIMTDNYGEETSWQVVQQGTGTVMGSGSGYGSNTLYSAEVCVASTGCYDFTIYDAYGDGICCSYGNGYYNVYYNGGLVGSGGTFGASETVGFIGGGCVLPNGACCVDGSCVATNTEPECDALSGMWYTGGNCATFQCPLLDCPGGSLFGQTPDDPDAAWSFGTSEVNVSGTNYLRFESYNVISPICDIHWWGINAYLSGSWQACTDSDPTYQIKFYADSAGVPGAEVASYTVTPTITPTGIIYAGLFNMAYFSVPSLSPCVTEFNGWVSIQGLGDNTCWFLWASSHDGDLSSCIMTNGVQDCTTYLYDLAVCLTGVYVPQFGACCDDSTGICDDNIEMINCSGRFAANTLCSALDPPCGQLPGACCIGTTCEELSAVACSGAGGDFQGVGTVCTPGLCGCPDAMITIQILTDTYPSETSWVLVEQGGGVVASGSGYAASTLYTIPVCVDSTSCYDFTIYDSWGDGIYAPGGYTVSYNGVEIANTMGGGFADYSDTVDFIGGGCTLPTGACCSNGICTGTVYEADCAGQWFMYEDCATYVCPQPQFPCPPESMFSQTPHGDADAWSFGTSEEDVDGTNYLRFESFAGVTAPICDIHWWGLQLYLSGSWVECDESDPSFEVKFYQDAGGVPGTEVASYVLKPTMTGTGVLYGGLYESIYYSVPAFSPCVTLASGWVSIQGLGDTDCWFLWLSSGEGDGRSCLMTDGVQDCVSYLYDNSLCLTPEHIPTYGACCDDSTGICEDNIEVLDCPGRFAANTLCSALDPQCGLLPGACCYPDGSCLDQTQGDCTGTFQGFGTNCASTSCPSPGDECEDAVALTIPTSVTGTTIGASNSAAPFCDVSNTAPDVWYSVIGNGHELTASLCNSTWDTKLTVYKNGCSTLSCVAGNDDAPCARKAAMVRSAISRAPAPQPFVLGRTDLYGMLKKLTDTRALQSEVTWCSEDGVEYLILVHGYGTATGDFTLDILDGDPCEETYCPASGGCDEYIARVQVGTIDNSTGCDGYADFTAMSTDVAIGASHGITVTLGGPYSSDTGGLWIDWNQDLDFDDADETITNAWSGTGPYVTTIIPPAGALLGETRMRVRMQYTGTPVPCGVTSYGEVEDYSVNVIPPVGACCDGAICKDGEQGDCAGMWLGVGTTCEGDCQPNGIADVCDLAYGTSPDCNDTDIPDECELAGNDCNSTGIPDDCELEDNDCNDNDVPDECDINAGTSEDCQGDGIPDECQLAAEKDIVLSEGFEGTIPPTGWTAVVNNPFTWEADTSGPYEGSQNAVCYYDETYSGTQDEWLVSSQLVMSGTVTLNGYSMGSVYWGITPYNNYDLEAWLIVGAGVNDGDDTLLGQIDTDTWVTTWAWTAFTYNFTAPGTPFRIGFRYYGYDGAQAGLDAITVEGETGPPPNDCNGNGVPDECDDPVCGNNCLEGGVGSTAEECDGTEDDACPGQCYPPGHACECQCPPCIVCGNGIVEPGEQCDGGPCCTPTCTFQPGTLVCRAAAGVCDAVEYCTGSAATCPTDVFLTSVCRASTGPCDPAESCPGTGINCPTDVKITACINGDGCCPVNCNATNDDDCMGCGNGVREGIEECDGADDADCPGECQANCTCPSGAIPTASTWGLVVLALLLLAGAKVYFGRRPARIAN
jgi:hypothetical protein